MSGHIQINSFAIYNPLLLVQLVGVGCKNRCAEDEHKGFHQEMENYFSVLRTFFGPLLGMALHGLALGLYNFLIFFVLLFCWGFFSSAFEPHSD